jgi:hypothetical protein
MPVQTLDDIILLGSFIPIDILPDVVKSIQSAKKSRINLLTDSGAVYWAL